MGFNQQTLKNGGGPVNKFSISQTRPQSDGICDGFENPVVDSDGKSQAMATCFLSLFTSRSSWAEDVANFLKNPIVGTIQNGGGGHVNCSFIVLENILPSGNLT